MPINTRLAPAKVRMILEDAECETLAVDEMSLSSLEATGTRPDFVEREPDKGPVIQCDGCV